MNLFNLELSKEDKEEMIDQEVSSVLEDSIKNEGLAVREKEHIVFARLLNFAQLKKANKAEIQEQYGIYIPRTDKNAGEGNIRIRKITKRNGHVSYEMTTKSFLKDYKVEVTVATSEANFQQFKVLAESGMLKHRYTFKDKSSGLAWSVDAIPDGNGGYYPWVRCEIEVKSLDDKVPPLPLETEEMIQPPELNSEITQEQYQERTRPLMARFFTLPNPHLEKKEAYTNTDLKTDEEKDEGTSVSGEASTESDIDKSVDDNVKTAENTTGDEVLSVDNITDDKETADKVEIRANQIAEARGDETDDETTESEEETTDDNSGSEEDNSDGESTDNEIESTAETEDPGWDEESSGKTNGTEKEEVSKEKLSQETFNHLVDFASGNFELD